MSSERSHLDAQLAVAIIESLPQLVVVLDELGQIEYVNPPFERLTGYELGDVRGRAWSTTFLPPADRERGARLFTGMSTEEDTRDRVTPISTRSGDVLPIAWRRVEAGNGSVGRGGVWVGEDLTSEQMMERERAEATLRASLRETETLLREVHHRVKNNLQIISSLLYFQAQRVHDPRDLAAFEDGRKRLTSMILVHEKLYQAGELSRIELGDYLRSLVSTLKSSFEDRKIVVELETATIRLPIELALPLGMIVCELVTNAFKYAFVDRVYGSISITLTRDADDVSLEVADDGVGFPAEFDVGGPGSFGWQLVCALVEQIDGTIETDSPEGARVRVRFRHPRERVASA